jgi:hypothetical protein
MKNEKKRIKNIYIFFKKNNKRKKITENYKNIFFLKKKYKRECFFWKIFCYFKFFFYIIFLDFNNFMKSIFVIMRTLTFFL